MYDASAAAPSPDAAKSARDDVFADSRQPTEVDVPASCTVALADARAAVLLALKAAARDSAEEAQLWKVLTFFDHLFFTLPRKRGGVKHQANGQTKLEAALTRRLTLFWDGAWSDLWREVRAAAPSGGQPHGAVLRRRALAGTPPSRNVETRRAARIKALIEAGELSRAAAVVV